MDMGRRHGGGGGYTLVSRLESEKSMEYLNLLQLYVLEISLAGTCALSYRQRYIEPTFSHLTTFCCYQTSQFWLQNREAGEG